MGGWVGEQLATAPQRLLISIASCRRRQAGGQPATPRLTTHPIEARDPSAPDHLGRHPQVRARLSGQADHGCRRQDAGQAKVGNLGGPCGADEHVGGLEVAVHDGRRVLLQRLHAPRHIQPHLQPLSQAARRQAPRAGRAVQPLGQRAAAAPQAAGHEAACGGGQLEAAVGGRRATPRNLPPGHHPPAPTHLSSSQTSQKSVGGAQHAAYSCMTCGWRSSDSASTSRTNVVACSRLRGATRFTATTPPRQVAECTTPAGQCGRHGRVGG